MRIRGEHPADFAAIDALERGDPRVRAPLQRTQENSKAIDVHVVLHARDRRHTVATSDPQDLHAVDPTLRLVV